MRGLNRFAASPARPITAAFSTHPYSTGRGRGRGANSPPAPSPPGHVPGQAESTAGEEEPFVSFGHGSGHPPLPSSAGLPSFSSLISSLKPSSSVGRGRGHTPSDTPQSRPKQPIFFRREDSESQPEKSQFADPSESAPLPSTFPPILSGSGRGKPTRTGESDTRAVEENRHLRIRSQPIGQRPPSSSPSQPKLGSEEAARRAVDILSRGGRSGPGGRGRGGRGLVGRGRGRGRGERFSGRRGRRDADHEFDLYLGDNADGEKLEKRLGEENMKILAEGFEEMSWRVLPSPTEEAYLDALHTNNMIEYEPEYIMEFDRNPDIEEKPPMPLEEVLATAKPFLMAYTGMKSQEEWEEAVNDLMERLPHIKELIDMYSGPDRVTAKQQQEELERVANTIPEKVPISVRRFADRAVLSLQSNPGWGFDKKCQFMDKLARDVSQHYK